MESSPNSASARSGPKPLVWFVPFNKANPYQPELAEQLKHLGVEVRGRVSLKGLVLERLRHLKAPPPLIHLHWIGSVETTIVRGLRMALFLTRVRLLRWLGCSFVWTVHNLYHHEAKHKRLDRRVARFVFRHSARVIVHSPTARTIVTEEFGVFADKIVTIPHGNYVDSYMNTVSRTEARTALGCDRESLVLLFLGNIRPYKGVLELMQVFSGWDAPSAQLLIVGRPLDSSMTEAIEACAKKDQRIQTRLGYLADADIQTYMNACDAVVFPYKEILTSGAVVLAMSFARACVAPQMGCMPDILDSDGAVLYDANDREGLLSALKQTLQRRARLEEMGRHNLARAAEWSWSSIARETAEVYFAAVGTQQQ